MDQWLRGAAAISGSARAMPDRGCPPRLAGAGRHRARHSAAFKIKPEAKIRQADGILFASYATLRSGTGEDPPPAIAGMADRISTA
jgi:hypothetical protein